MSVRRGSVVVVIAALGHGLEAGCAEAYRETAPDAEIRVVHGNDVAHCWLRGGRPPGQLLHLTSELAEPHPGWLEAAAAATLAGCLPCATLWTPDGVPVDAGPVVDWEEADDCVLPFLRRRDWRLLSPALEMTPEGLEAIVGGDPVELVTDGAGGALTRAAAGEGLRPRRRTAYAFTWHEPTLEVIR